jgi:hypothetical protein
MFAWIVPFGFSAGGRWRYCTGPSPELTWPTSRPSRESRSVWRFGPTAEHPTASASAVNIAVLLRLAGSLSVGGREIRLVEMRIRPQHRILQIWRAFRRPCGALARTIISLPRLLAAFGRRQPIDIVENSLVIRSCPRSIAATAASNSVVLHAE